MGKIYANFSGEIVTSSSILDHRDMVAGAIMDGMQMLNFPRPVTLG